MTERLEFIARLPASSFRPNSSLTSLFFEKLMLTIPLLRAIFLAKTTKPESVNEFLLISRTFMVWFSSKKVER